MTDQEIYAHKVAVIRHRRKLKAAAEAARAAAYDAADAASDAAYAAADAAYAAADAAGLKKMKDTL